jgi:hypothetical protein
MPISGCVAKICANESCLPTPEIARGLSSGLNPVEL